MTIRCPTCPSENPHTKRIDTGRPVRTRAIDRGISHRGECDACPSAIFEERRGLSLAQAQKKVSRDFDAEEYRQFLETYDNVTRLDRHIKIRSWRSP